MLLTKVVHYRCGCTLLTITQLETHQVHSTSHFEFARSTQSAVARLLYFEGISYGFCDAYCRGHTGSRPERAVGSLLASLSGKVPGTARQNTLNHLGLVPGSLGNRWKKALGSWLGLLPQHVTGMSSILRCSRSYFNRFSLFAHRLYRQVPCQTPQSHELCNPYGFSHAQVSNRPLPIL